MLSIFRQIDKIKYKSSVVFYLQSNHQIRTLNYVKQQQEFLLYIIRLKLLLTLITHKSIIYLSSGKQMKTQRPVKTVIGIDLGNSITTIYFNHNFYQLHSQITINLNNKSISIGQPPTSLEQKLQAKYKSLKQNLSQQGQQQNNRQSDNQKRIVDFLDLYIKAFTHRNLSLQQRQKDIFQSTLPKCFNYYGHQFQEEDREKIYIVLQKNKRINSKDLIISRNNNKTKHLGKEEENPNIVSKIQEQTITLDECLRSFVCKVLQELLQQQNHKEATGQQNDKKTMVQQLQLVVNYRGFEGNAYLTSLSNIKSLQVPQINVIKQIITSVNFIYSTTSQAIYLYVQYLRSVNKSIDKSTLVACLDFGSRGFSFSIFQLYPTNQNVIQSLQHFSCQFGGVDVTRILVDIIIDHVKLHKGVDIGSTPQMTQQLYKLAEQTKIALTQADKVYVRIEGYPLQQPYGFYLKRFNLQRIIQAKCLYLVSEINRLINKYPNKIRYFVVSGQSLNIPLFKELLNEKLLRQLTTQIIESDRTWIAKGNFLWRQSGVIILQKSQSQIVIKGDEEYVESLLEKGQDMPVRLIKEIPFPRGELAYQMRFYQNQTEIGKYIIESKNLEWGQNINFVTQKEENKPLFVYSTKYLGNIELRGNKLCKQLNVSESVKFDVNFVK